MSFMAAENAMGLYIDLLGGVVKPHQSGLTLMGFSRCDLKGYHTKQISFH